MLTTQMQHTTINNVGQYLRYAADAKKAWLVWDAA